MADDKDGQYFKPPSDASKWQKFKAFLWNSEKKEFLGRTGISWLKITVFYIIFYACLAAFWTVMLIIFYQTLSATEPRWTLGSSRIGTNPGLGFRPRPPDDNIDSTLIWFNTGDNKTIEHWVKNLDEFLEPYRKQKDVVSCSTDQGAGTNGTCYFSLSQIDDSCSINNSFGYFNGTPCVLIKLNRIFGWTPDTFENEAALPSNVPKSVKDNFAEDHVSISCEGENAADKDNLGEVKYTPLKGISKMYFPFTNRNEYLSPFVFVKFEKIAKHILINIECKAWAKNIKPEKQDRLGMVHFELLVD